MQKTPPRAALYVRLSEDKTRTGDNVRDQERGARQIANERLGAQVVQVYDDNDRVASDPKRKPRPEFERMLRDAEAGAFDMLVCRHADRLFRTPYDEERISEIFGPRGIVIHQEWAGYPLDLSTPNGVFNAGMYAQVARYETDQKRQRQKAKTRMVAHAGRVPEGGPIPYGYQTDRTHLNTAQANVVRGAYRAVLEGASLGSVLRDLNARGVPTPRWRAPFIVRPWTYSTLRNVLLRPLNARLVFHNGAIVPGVIGEWQALVTEEEFYAVRALLTDPARRTSSGNQRKHLLAGIARCGNCTKPLKSGHVGSRSGKRAYLYRCVNPGCTRKVNVSRDQLDTYVVERLLTERGDLPVVIDRPQADLGPALAQVENTIRGQAARLADDDADTEAVVARIAELKAERAALRASPQRATWGFLGVTEQWRATQDLEGRRAVLLGHLDTLLIASRGKTSHRFDPERVTLAWQEFAGAQIPGSVRLVPADLQSGEVYTIGPMFVTRSGEVIYSDLPGAKVSPLHS